MPKKIRRYFAQEPVFDGYNEDSSIQDALGSKRTRQRQEASSMRSTNYKKDVSGWKISPSQIEASPISGTFTTTDGKTVTVTNGIITSIT